MWMPTHVQVTVQRAEGLLIKGKNNTNDSFVTIALGKTKYRTSVKEKAGQQVEWHEECELPIPEQGNTAEIVLTALHQNLFGVEEFLGRVCVPLRDLDIYERPKNKWYILQSKPGKEKKNKDRGRLEVKIAFTVKSGSLTNLNVKEPSQRLSISSTISNAVGGSLMSLRSAEKRKGIKKFAKSIGSKMNLKGKKKNGNSEDDASSFNSSVSSLQNRNNPNMKLQSGQTGEDADPGVVSDEEDEFTFDELSHKSSASSVNHTVNTQKAPVPIIKTSVEDVNVVPSSPTIPKVNIVPPPKPPRDEWETKLVGNRNKNVLRPRSTENLNRRSWDFTALDSHIEEDLTIPDNKQDTVSLKLEPTPEIPKKDGMFSKFKHFRKEKEDSFDQTLNMPTERIIIGKENKKNLQHSNISNELLQKFEGKSREDLILTICDVQHDLERHKKKLRDLEDYLDELLLRVMETTPRILQNPYVNCKFEHRKMSEY